jgi:hypothetical protein
LSYDGRVRFPETAAVILTSIVLCHAAAARADPLFDIDTIESRGRSVAAELADLDGDGRTDLMVVVLLGIPPEEQRRVRVYLQKPDGSLPRKPDYAIEVPERSAAYDLADLKGGPGQELVLLRPEGLTLLSLADASGKRWQLPAAGAATAGLADDERGFERFRLVYRDFGPEPWLLVPQVGQLLVLSPGGGVRAQLEIPRRANYFIARDTGLLSVESDFQVFVDVPKLAVGDVDGDGLVDIVFSTRHELWVYLRREDGSFPGAPDRRLALRLVTPRDHIRGSGGVASTARDIDGDGRLDLLVTHVEGSFTDTTSTTYIYMNRSGQWKLGEPDHAFRSKASLDSHALLDLDGDGRLELLRTKLGFGLLELVELLLTRELDVQVFIHRYDAEPGFNETPWMKTQVELPFSLDTFRLKGFMPTAEVDLNADGIPDFVSSGGGNAIEVSLGDGRTPFAKRRHRQKVPTAGVIHFGDLDGDGLSDFVIFDPQDFDVPVRVGRNRGELPSARPLPREQY